MRTIGNVLWLVLAGWWLAIGYVIAGILNCITIIGIPFGVQAFKLAAYALWPSGRTLVPSASRSKGLSVIGNILWFVLILMGLVLVHEAGHLVVAKWCGMRVERFSIFFGKPFQVPEAAVGNPTVCPWCQATVPALPVGGAAPSATPQAAPLSLDDEPQLAPTPSDRRLWFRIGMILLIVFLAVLSVFLASALGLHFPN